MWLCLCFPRSLMVHRPTLSRLSSAIRQDRQYGRDTVVRAAKILPDRIQCLIKLIQVTSPDPRNSTQAESIEVRLHQLQYGQMRSNSSVRPIVHRVYFFEDTVFVAVFPTKFRRSWVSVKSLLRRTPPRIVSWRPL